MKSIIYLLSILLLFQSCYSYKTFDLKEYETVKPKKVKIILKDVRKIKGKIIEFTDDKITIEKENQVYEISKSEIVNIKKRKFSLIKTVITVLAESYLLVKISEKLLFYIIRAAI